MTALEKLSLSDYIERKYEADFNEPWSKLEERVRARHPDFFEIHDALEPKEHKKKWWQIWK